MAEHLAKLGCEGKRQRAAHSPLPDTAASCRGVEETEWNVEKDVADDVPQPHWGRHERHPLHALPMRVILIRPPGKDEVEDEPDREDETETGNAQLFEL